MVRGLARILARGIKPVDLGLQLRIRLGMGENAEEYARQAARGGVRPSDDGKNTVVDELLERRRGLV